MKSKEELTEQLSGIHDEIMQLIGNDKFNHDDHSKLWNEMVDTAHELHKIVNPKHTRIMLQNREISPNDREFYDHVHPVEDLLKFIKDPHANDDPVDKTINADFKLKVYSRRWGHNDTYKVKRTETGWEIGHISISGECDKTGTPFLFKNLDHDSINYPEDLGGYMEYLWDQAYQKGLSHEQVQSALNELGEWICECEIKSPKGIWEYYR
jgi:hypothetical protein